MHLNVPPCTAGCVQRLKDKLPDIRRIQPCGTQLHRNLTGGQVHGLHLLQCLHIGKVLRLCFRFCPHLCQLPPHVAGQILVGGQVFLAALFPVIRVQKDDALQVREQGILVLAGKLSHIRHIYAGFLPDGQGQRFHRRVNPLGRPVAADGALGEQVGFPLQAALLVQHLQRTQQEIGAILVKDDGVAARIDKPIVMGKAVIEVVQLCLLLAYHAIRIVLRLILQQRPHTIPQADHTADAALGSLGHLHRVHAAVLTVIELVIHQRIGKIADGGICRDGLIFSLQLLRPVVGIDLAVDILHGVGKEAVQRLLRKRHTGGLRAIRSRYHFHLAQHHIRVVDEITVHGDTVVIRPQLHPVWLNVHHAVTFLQEQDVRYHLRTRCRLEGIVGQTDRAQQLRPLGNVLPHVRGAFVHGVAGGNERHHAARPHLIQRLGKEILMDGQIQPVIAPILHLELTKGNVAHSHVKEVVGEVHLFIAANGNTAAWVQLTGDASGYVVQLHAVDLALRHALRQHTEEMTDAAGRLQHVALPKAHLSQRGVDATDHHRRRIEGGQCGFPRRGVLCFGQQPL